MAPVARAGSLAWRLVAALAAAVPSALPAVVVPGIQLPPVTVPPVSVPSVSVPSVPPLTTPPLSTPVLTTPPLSTPVLTLPEVTTVPLTVPDLVGASTTTTSGSTAAAPSSLPPAGGASPGEPRGAPDRIAGGAALPDERVADQGPPEFGGTTQDQPAVEAPMVAFSPTVAGQQLGSGGVGGGLAPLSAPLALIALIVAFLVLQHRFDRGDPKLILAEIDRTDRMRSLT